MDALFLAQAAPGSSSPGFFMTIIQQTLSKLLSTGGLTGWVNTVLPAFQFIGFIVCTVSLSRRFVKSKENPGEMVFVVVAMVLTLWMVGQPRYVFGVANKAASSIMPQEFQASWGADGTFTPPTIVNDISKQLKQSIAGPSGSSTTGANSDATQQFKWYKLGVDRLIAGVKGLDPRLLIAQAVTAVVEFFADASLFILAVMYLVMALIMEVNLLVFPAMIALWHTDLFGSSSREFCKHCIAVYLWPLGWGIGLLSAEGVMGGMSTVDGTISGIIAFALSLFLVCFWLIFAAIAGPVLFHKLVTQGASIGQGLMAGGTASGGAMVVGAAGWTAGMALKGVSKMAGSAVSALGSGVGKLIAGGGNSGDSSGSSRDSERGGKGGGGNEGKGGNRTNADDSGSRSSLVRSLRGARDSGDGKSGSSGESHERKGLGDGGSQSEGDSRSDGSSGSSGESSGENGEADSTSGSSSSQGKSGAGGKRKKPGVVARMRQAVGNSISNGSQAAGQWIGGTGGSAIGGLVNHMAARGALKMDQAGHELAEVGNATTRAARSSQRTLQKRADAPILPFPKPLDRGNGGGGDGGGGTQAQPPGGRTRFAAAVPRTPQNSGNQGGGSQRANDDTIEGEWELVQEDRPQDRGGRRRS